jgi:DNA repair exonuclease SbcCD nuclease subunit
MISRTALLNSDQIPQYNALGHMHRGQCVPETVAPTYYAGAPDRFERGEEEYEPSILLVNLPDRGVVEVDSMPLKETTPFISKVIGDRNELVALADSLGETASARALGDLVIRVDDIADYPPLRDEAYQFFPRLKEANTVRPEEPESAMPVKFETTADYAQVSNPRMVFDEFFSGGFSEDQVPHLQRALDTILGELTDEN